MAMRLIACLKQWWPDKAIIEHLSFAAVVAFALLLRSIWLIRPGFRWAIDVDSGLYLALTAGLQHGCGFAPGTAAAAHRN